MASDSSVYVADKINNRIQKFTSDGVFINKWGTGGPGDGEFSWPSGVAVASDGSVYVADSDNNRIQKFGSTEEPVISEEPPVFVMEVGNSGTGDGMFQIPRDVAVASDGSIYVADSASHRVQKFTSEGAFVWKIGKPGNWLTSRGSGDGEFIFPFSIAVAPGNDIYVADKDNYRIQRFNPDGTFVSEWGSQGSGDGEFSDAPAGVAVASDGSVYVADRGNNRIQRFTSEGVFVSEWGTEGSGDGEFGDPEGLTVASDGSVYVADTGGDSIQKFR